MARPAATPAPQQAAEPGVIGGFCLGVVKVLGLGERRDNRRALPHRLGEMTVDGGQSVGAHHLHTGRGAMCLLSACDLG